MSANHFDDRFVRELPADTDDSNRRRQVMGACYSFVTPTPVSAPALLAFSREVAELLGIDQAELASPEWVEALGGNRVLPGMRPYATCYGGHQFGSWAGQLGDGRAITLGERINPRGAHWEIQLKGAGPTPYSRTADGRAVMRSSVREFVCSEAMHHLGVPTTRALSLVGTGDQVLRDMLYDGNAQYEPGAIVCRVAPSFIRFGNFEIFTARGDEETLRALADHTIRTHFPELDERGEGGYAPSVYAAWFEEVCRRTAIMVAHWMRVGFVHGVMNTDNMSILGLTIDYGPYGWLEGFDPNWTPNTTDEAMRRYRYGFQPKIAGWNLSRLAGAILPLVKTIAPLERAMERYSSVFGETQREHMAAKLGLRSIPDDPACEEARLVEELGDVLKAVETDMTLFYRRLADVPVAEDCGESAWLEPLRVAYYADPDAAHIEKTTEWLRRYRALVRAQDWSPEARRARMNSVNPKYVLRNYLAQLAIDRANEGDGAKVTELLDVMRRPYDEQPGREEFAEKRPEWARHRVGCSMLSCSS